MCVGVYEAIREAGADLWGGDEGGEGGGEEVGELAEGAGWPRVDLEVWWVRS